MKIKKTKYLYISTITLLFIGSIVLNELMKTHWLTLAVLTLLTILTGFHIFKKALVDIRYKIIGIDLLVTLAVIAAFVIGDLFEAAAVTYLFTLGHFLEKMSLEKTRSAIKSMLDLKPLVGRRIDNHIEIIINYDEINVDDILLVKPGEKIPTDGIIIEGEVMVDEAMMTGESMPNRKTVGDQVIGSTVVASGYLLMKVTEIGEDTTLSKMIHMVEEAQDNKAKTQKFMEVFSKYYTPLVVLISIVIYLITFDIRLAVTMLVIACPGALVIATPVSFVAGIGNAAKKGILFKGGDSIERLAKGNLVFFDKTGTLTKGKPEVVMIKTYGISEEELIKIATIGESYSEHPIASAIKKKAETLNLDTKDKPNDTTPIIGQGLSFTYLDITYRLGNKGIIKNELNQEIKADFNDLENKGYTTLILENDHQILGLIGIRDGLRPQSKSMIESLKTLKIEKSIMLTGDQKVIASQIADELSLDAYYANLMPQDKAEIVKNYQKDYHTIFVGDGINDALALSYADASVAVGGLGKDLAMEAADIVLMGEDISKLKDAIKISRKVKNNMIQNIVFALVIVFLLMIGVLLKQVTMSIGMLVHEASVLIVIMNAIRLLRYDLGGKDVKKSRTLQLHQESSNL